MSDALYPHELAAQSRLLELIDEKCPVVQLCAPPFCGAGEVLSSIPELRPSVLIAPDGEGLSASEFQSLTDEASRQSTTLVYSGTLGATTPTGRSEMVSISSVSLAGLEQLMGSDGLEMTGPAFRKLARLCSYRPRVLRALIDANPDLRYSWELPRIPDEFAQPLADAQPAHVRAVLCLLAFFDGVTPWEIELLDVRDFLDSLRSSGLLIHEFGRLRARDPLSSVAMWHSFDRANHEFAWAALSQTPVDAVKQLAAHAALNTLFGPAIRSLIDQLWMTDPQVAAEFAEFWHYVGPGPLAVSHESPDSDTPNDHAPSVAARLESHARRCIAQGHSERAAELMLRRAWWSHEHAFVDERARALRELHWLSDHTSNSVVHRWVALGELLEALVAATSLANLGRIAADVVSDDMTADQHAILWVLNQRIAQAIDPLSRAQLPDGLTDLSSWVRYEVQQEFTLFDGSDSGDEWARPEAELRTCLQRAIAARKAGQREDWSTNLSRATAIRTVHRFDLWNQAIAAESQRFDQANRLRDKLTDAEYNVAALAANGWTSKRIAQHLELSPRTVDVHLGRIYKKMALPGRSELVALFDHETVTDATG